MELKHTWILASSISLSVYWQKLLLLNSIHKRFLAMPRELYGLIEYLSS